MTSRDRVVLVERIHDDGIVLLERGADVVVLDGPHDPLLSTALSAADAVIVRSTRFGADLIDAAPRLRVIGRHGAGTDNIDREAAERRDIVIVNTPRSNTESVAEYVIAAMFAVAKHLEEGAGRLASGDLPPDQGSLPSQVVRHGLVGRELAGATLGLVGLGAIGRSVARRATALGMTVIASDPYVPAAVFAELGVTPVERDVLLGVSDVVSLHVPGDAVDRPLIGAEELRGMRDGAILVNAARGSLVDADALVAEARTGRIRAAIDVFDPEPPAVDSPLLSTPGILATPHLAAMTAEALVRMAVDVAEGTLNALAASRAH